MHEVSIYLEGAGEETLFVHLEELFSRSKMRKKLLNRFGYMPSESKHIELSLMEVYEGQPSNVPIPVFNEISYRQLMGFLLTNDRPVKIKGVATTTKDITDLKRKGARTKLEGEFEFDENGSVISESGQRYQRELGNIIPAYPLKYGQEEAVRCGFCLRSSNDKDGLVKCGGIYGPFLNGKYSHLLCAIWCHSIYLDKEDKLQNVEQSMIAASQIVCTVCKKEGAGLECFQQNLGKKKKKIHFAAHYQCAVESGCKMNWTNYKMICGKCRPKKHRRRQIEVNESSDQDYSHPRHISE